MSSSIQAPSINVTEMSLFAAESEAESQEKLDSSMPDNQGAIKTAAKNYTCSQQAQTAPVKKLVEFVKTLSQKTAFEKPTAEKLSPMQMASSSYQSFSKTQTESKSPIPTPTVKQQNPSQNQTSPPQTKSQHPPLLQGKNGSVPHTTNHAHPSTTQKTTAHNRSNEAASSARQEKTEKKNEQFTPLISRQWTKKETKQWWEARYHQREKGGEHKGRDQQQEHQEEEKPLRVSKTASVSSKNRTPSVQVQEVGHTKVRKPELAPPKVGVFALYYLLTKIGISSDGASNFAYKKEIDFVDEQTTATHKKRLEELKEAIKQEKESQRWGVAVKVFSWIGSLLGMITGVALVATGVGAVAGAMLIVGSALQIGNQLMEVAGGWQKVAALLPGEDTEKKRAVISWMQIGIAVLCLILSGAGVIWGGFASFGQAMQTASAMLGGIAAMGFGVTTIGEGISGFLFKDHMGDIKKYDLRLAQLKHMRQDLMEKVEWGVDRLEQLFEDLANALEFEEELFQADQMFYRR